MGTRGETTVEIEAALLHHHSHLPRNHIYTRYRVCRIGVNSRRVKFSQEIMLYHITRKTLYIITDCFRHAGKKIDIILSFMLCDSKSIST